MQVFEFETVVIGSGLAGLTAAYHSSKFGSVAVVTKSQLDTSNSYYAQGGIAAAIAKNDSTQQHLEDTLTAGRGLCDYEAVKVLVTEGKQCVLELIESGMSFDKHNGEYVLGLENNHGRRRILHAGGDATGKELTTFFLQRVKEQSLIKAFEYHAVIMLLKKEDQIVGVQAFDFQSGENVVFKSKAVILATGGLSRVFARSTNPHTATGDGIALAYEAGAKIADLEFIQFHPSALYVPGKDAYLISEAVRGEGAWLLNQKGERFMKDIHPLAELAPRDIVAYNIFREIQKSEAEYVYLSLKHLDAKNIKRRFHHIYLNLKEFGFDLTKDFLPISPAAHYMVGGIRSNLDAQTNVKGLFVCGEAASTGVMGANRLASNSLLECLVFGKRASEKAAKMEYINYGMPEIELIKNEKKNEQLYLDNQNEIAKIMSKHLGVVRNKTGLKTALERLNKIAEDFKDFDFEYNKLKVKNTAEICRLIANAALIREESRGGHIREDFQKENPDFRIHTIQQRGSEITFEPIREK